MNAHHSVTDILLCPYAAWRCVSSTPTAAPPAVRCLAQVGRPHHGAAALVAAAMSNGSVSLLDARARACVTTWRAHDGSCSCIAALCEAAPYALFTGSSDRLLCLWDIRRLGPASQAQSPTRGAVAMSSVATWAGHKDGVACVASSPGGECVMSTAAGRVAQLSCRDVLAPRTPGDQAGTEARGLKPGRLVREAPRGGLGPKEKALIEGIHLLPAARAALVASNDGILRLCV